MDPGPPGYDSRKSASGRWVLVGLLALGGLMAASNLWLQRRQSYRAVEFWGRQQARVIARAAQVSLLVLGRPQAQPPADHSLRVGKDYYPVLLRRQISGAGGLTHLRRALVLDHFYRSLEPVPHAPRWQGALVFSLQDREVVVLLDELLEHVGRRDGLALQVRPVQGRSLLQAVVGEIIGQNPQMRKLWHPEFANSSGEKSRQEDSFPRAKPHDEE